MYSLIFILFASSAFASEGLFSISELKKRPGHKDSYVEFKGSCGGIRIHNSKKYVLTALHCVTNEIDSINAERSIELGNHFAYDSINYFADLKGRKLKNGATVMAAGRCFTGLDPEVLHEETRANRLLAFKCALGDWAILEMPSLAAKECSAIAQTEPASVMALGATIKTIIRTVGLQELKGHVYTNGTLYPLQDIIAHKDYVFGSLWSNMTADFKAQLDGKFQITDSDVMGGMSGGPVITQDFKIFAVTTTAVLPGNLWRYEGAYAFEDGFNFGIHGAIRVSEIVSQIKSKGLKPDELFNCPAK